MPMQDGPDLPERIGRALWTIYSEVYDSQQSYERIVERHGFTYVEVSEWMKHLRQRRYLETDRLFNKEKS